MFKFNLLKKAITPAIGISLLLVVSIFTVIGFQNWYNDFSNSLLVDVSSQTNLKQPVSVEGIIGDKLYLKTGEHNKINLVKINNIDCSISNKTLSKTLDFVNVSDCIENVSGIVKILLVTDIGVVEETKYITNRQLNVNSVNSCSTLTWEPNLNSVCLGESFTQNSLECSGETRLINGTKIATFWGPDPSTVCLDESFIQNSVDCSGQTRLINGTKIATSWSPDPNTVNLGVSFTQNSIDCLGQTRDSVGTKPVGPLNVVGSYTLTANYWCVEVVADCSLVSSSNTCLINFNKVGITESNQFTNKGQVSLSKGQSYTTSTINVVIASEFPETVSCSARWDSVTNKIQVRDFITNSYSAWIDIESY